MWTALWEAVHVTPAGGPGRVLHSAALTGLTSDFSVSSCLLCITLDSSSRILPPSYSLNFLPTRTTSDMIISPEDLKVSFIKHLRGKTSELAE